MPDLKPVFVELRRRMSLHEDVFRRSANLTDANGRGARKANDPEPETSYLLLGAATEKYPDGMMFGAVKIGKRYVSYHLMCVYLQPDLITAMSPQLRNRMQGKSCFNFTKVDEELFDELSAITAKGREMYVAQGWLASWPTGQPRGSETSDGSAAGADQHVINMPLIRPRVAVYVVRRLGDGIELLVFELEGLPEMGTQVPAGGIRPTESRKEAALREVKEETGLVALRVVTELGIVESPHPASGQSRQTSYWVLEAAKELPSEWRHAAASHDEDGGIVFLCRWEPLPLVVALVDQQGSLLSQLPLRLG